MASSRHLAATAALIAVALGAPGASADADRGEKLFKTCSPCHGEDAAGNQELGAPALAGLGQWYLQAQIEKFQTRVRGAHPEDEEGMRMRPMSRALESPEEVEAVSAYLAGLPRSPLHSSLEGDAARGATLYKPCAACHGPDAAGIQQLNGPSLTHTNDWYLLRQLQKFKVGLRGANPEDKTGLMMRPMTMTLVDEQAMRDVIAYIMTLAK